MNFRDTLTVEQRKIYRHCLYEATKYFNVQKGYVLHHKDITMRETNLERYRMLGISERAFGLILNGLERIAASSIVALEKNVNSGAFGWNVL